MNTWRRRPPSDVFSLFVSNLPTAISKTELEAMFCRAGKVFDSFIPVDRSSGKQRGFGFVRFKSQREAQQGIELVNGRSWSGRRIRVDFAHPRPSNPTATAALDQKQISFSNQPSAIAWARPPNCIPNPPAGWIVRDGHANFIRVAPWVIESGKKTLCCSLIGFLKPNHGIAAVDGWLKTFWGNSAVTLKLLEDDIIHIQLLSEDDLRQVLRCASDSPSSPFVALDRWMEVIGSPPTPKWVRFHGVPLHAWHEGVFRLLGDFIGSTIEVHRPTSEKETIAYGCVKVLMSRICKLPVEIPLSVGDLVISVRAEEEGVASLTSGVQTMASVAEGISGSAGELPPSDCSPSSGECSSSDECLRSNRSRARRRARTRRRATMRRRVTSARPTSLASSQQEAWTWPLSKTDCGPRVS